MAHGHSHGGSKKSKGKKDEDSVEAGDAEHLCGDAEHGHSHEPVPSAIDAHDETNKGKKKKKKGSECRTPKRRAGKEMTMRACSGRQSDEHAWCFPSRTQRRDWLGDRRPGRTGDSHVAGQRLGELHRSRRQSGDDFDDRHIHHPVM